MIAQQQMEKTIYANGKYYSESEFTKVQFKILEAMQKYGDYITRFQLIDQTNISGSTIFENLCKLLAKGIIIEKIVILPKKGRPTHFYKIKGAC